MNRAGKILLSPFAALYGGLVAGRQALYDAGIFKRLSFEVPVLCIGNLSTGGTGKSPMAAYLLEKLRDENPALLSRGYGRSTRGFQWVRSNSEADECGDEPLMIKRQFPDLPVAVCESRALAIPQILMGQPETGLVIMDDGMQHLAVKPDALILLSTWQEPFTRDYLLPAGRLRERRHRAAKADFIIVTKTPDDTDSADKSKLVAEIRQYSEAPVYFAGLEYPPLQNISGGQIPDSKRYQSVLAVSGLAKSQLFEEKIKAIFPSASFQSYRDHYRFQRKDVEKWINKLKNGEGPKAIVTSQKDRVRIEPFLPILQKEGIEMLIQDVGIRFHEQEEEFLSELRQKLRRKNQ